MDKNEAIDIVLQSCRKALRDFFDTMCPLKYIEGSTYRQEDPNNLKGSFEMVGLISFTGTSKGSVSIHVDRSLGAKIAQTMLGLEEIDNEDDINDTVGELTNIIVGGAKNYSADAGCPFEITCPMVVRGKNGAEVAPPSDSVYALAKYQIEDMPMLIMSYVVE